MRLLILCLLVVLFFFKQAMALTFYNITLIDGKIFVNVTFDVTAEEAYDIWRITWEIPQDYEILSVKDEKGYVSFTTNKGYIYFETNPMKAKRRIINIEYFLNDVISLEYKPLKKVQLYLPNFEREKTIVNVYIPNIISGDASFGFTEYFGDSFAQFTGFGPVDIVIYYGTGGKEYENYLLFGSADLAVADKMFSIIINTTGFEKPYKRFPVVVLDDKVFEKTIQPWGSASHTRGGLILVKKSIANNPYNVSTLLHETTHAINAKVLKWNQANSTWFEEGTASFIEFLTNQQLGLEQPELFGKNKIIRKNGEKIVIKSKGNREDLWNYYKEGKDFMLYWNPSDEKHRDFGYAFSELVIRYSVEKNSIEKMKEVYKDLRKINRTVKDNVESTNILLSILDTNFMPCYSVSREIFDECIDNINNQKFFIPQNARVESMSGEIVNHTFELNNYNLTNNEIVNSKNWLQKMIGKIMSFLENLFKPRN